MASGNKRRQAELDAAQKERDSAVTALKEPDPGETYVKGKNLEFLKAYNGESGPVNVAELPGMSSYMDLFNRSRNPKARHRVGTAAFGAQFADPNLLAQMDREDQSAREENAGGMFEDAVAGKYAEASGSVLPYAQLAFQRNATRMGASGDRFNQATAAANAPPWWMPLALAGVGGVSTATGAYLGPH